MGAGDKAEDGLGLARLVEYAQPGHDAHRHPRYGKVGTLSKGTVSKPKYTNVYNCIQKYTNVYKSIQKYTNVYKSVQIYTKL